MKRMTKRTLRLERLEDRQMLSVSPIAPEIEKLASRTSVATATSDFTFAFTDANTSDTHAAAVDWGDGTPYTHLDSVTSPFTLNHKYDSIGTYRPRLWVTDSTNRTDIETFTMKVYPNPANKLQAPVIKTVGDRTAIAGAIVSLDFEFTDPNNDKFRATLDWGDGTELEIVPYVGRTFTLEHFYQQVGTFTPTLTIIDSTERTATETFSMTIYPNPTNPDWRLRAPVMSEGQPKYRTALERVEVDYTFYFSDKNVGDTFTAAIDWGDGSPITDVEVDGYLRESVNANHRFEDTGTYDARLWITDSGNRSVLHEFTVEVFPHAGAGIINTGPQTGHVLSPTRIELELVDSDPNDSYFLAVDWGDAEQNVAGGNRSGQIPTVPGRETVEHNYYFPGTYDVTASITERLYSEVRTFPVTIVNHPDAPVLKDMEPMTTFVLQQTEFKFEFNDDTPGDTHTLLFCAREFWQLEDHYWIEDPEIELGRESPCERRQVSSPAIFHHVYHYRTTHRPQVWLSDESGHTAYYQPLVVNAVDGEVPPLLLAEDDSCFVVNASRRQAGCNVRFVDDNLPQSYDVSIDWGNGVVQNSRIHPEYYDELFVTGGHVYDEDGTYLITISIIDSMGLESTLEHAIDFTI